MASTPPFGLVLPSRPVLVNASTISTTQYAFTFPSLPTFTHVVVFLMPGVVLPDGTLAGVYIQTTGSTAGFKLLGAVGNEKQSAIFRVFSGSGPAEPDAVSVIGTEDQMSDVDSQNAIQDVTVGLSIEPAATILAQLESIKASSTSSPSTALVMSNSLQSQLSPVSTKVLAQRIIKNAFNFLASFAGTSGEGGQEVVPLKSFQDWWSKFERRIENDPRFLEKEIDQ